MESGGEVILINPKWLIWLSWNVKLKLSAADRWISKTMRFLNLFDVIEKRKYSCLWETSEERRRGKGASTHKTLQTLNYMAGSTSWRLKSYVSKTKKISNPESLRATFKMILLVRTEKNWINAPHPQGSKQGISIIETQIAFDNLRIKFGMYRKKIQVIFFLNVIVDGIIRNKLRSWFIPQLVDKDCDSFFISYFPNCFSPLLKFEHQLKQVYGHNTS